MSLLPTTLGMFPGVLWERVLKLATDNRFFRGQVSDSDASDSLATNGAIQICTVLYCIVYLPQTRNSICYLIAQNCMSMLYKTVPRQFINCSPYLFLDKAMFFLSVLF